MARSGGWHRPPSRHAKVPGTTAPSLKSPISRQQSFFNFVACDNAGTGAIKLRGPHISHAATAAVHSVSLPFNFCELCGNGCGVLACPRCNGDGKVTTRRGGAGAAGLVGMARCKMCTGTVSSGVAHSIQQCLNDTHNLQL